MLVRIERDFDYLDLKRQTPQSSGVWGDLRITYDPVPECDLLVVLNSPHRDIWVRCPPGNRWLFSQESPVEMYRWHRESFKHFDKVFTFWDDVTETQPVHDQTMLPWLIGKTYDELRALPPTPDAGGKRDDVSWVTSAATHKPGHKLRMAFKDYLQASDFPVDLFGRGFTPIKDKFDGIYPYKYSIAIENYACDHYWTEKLADCFLSWTMPIYWGATNVLSYFPADSMILIDPNDPARSLETIREAIETDRHGRHLAALAEARERVLSRYQFFPYLQQLIERHGARGNTRTQKYFVPTNSAHYGLEDSVQRVKRLIKRALRM